MTPLLLIILLLLSSSPAYAEWVKVGEYDSYTAYIDPDTIRHKGNRVKVWRLFDHTTIQTVAGKSYLSSKAQMEYDCAKEQSRILVVYGYSGQMGSSTLVGYDTDPTKWRPVMAGSVDQAMWKVSCGKLINGPAHAEWVRIGENDRSVGWADTEIRRSGDMVEMWVLFDYKSIQSSQRSGKRYFSEKAQYEIDCRSERERVLFFTWHAEKMGNGVVVYTGRKPTDWEPANSPGSYANSLLRFACGKR